MKRYWLRLWYLPISVAGIGLLSLVMLAVSNRISEEQLANFKLADVLMDIQIHTANSHVWLEETLTGDEHVDLETIMSDFAFAESQAEVILTGGKTEHGLSLAPAEDRRIKDEVTEIHRLLVDLRAIAMERSRNPNVAGIGSDLDVRFDAVYNAFQKKAFQLERMVEGNQIRIRKYSRNLFIGLLFVWIAILAAAAAAIWMREKRRLAAEDALKTANYQLQIQKEELNRHRDHLQELVEERTGELRTANQSLRNEIVERIRAEENVWIYEEVTRNMPVGMYVWQTENGLDPSVFKLVAANPAAAEISKRRLRDLPGKTLGEIFPALPGTEIDCCIHEAYNTGRMKCLEEVHYSDEHVPDGFFAVKAFRLPNDCLGMLLEDVTGKVKLQADAVRASHLASLGELAAGVAHEINNPVNGVINYAQLLVDDFGKKNEDPELPDRIIKEGRRIATIVRSLLSFAREREGERQPVRIGDLLTECLDLTGAQLRKDGILLQIDSDSALPQIDANGQQIQQVFLNLINNARYALNQKYPFADENKIIRVETRPVRLNDSAFVEVSVFDTGIGIPANIRHKVILPFFTTKPMGMGTGLGLSISHGIVSDHAGKLFIQSREGEYTRVQVLLPAKEVAVQPPRHEGSKYVT